VLAAKALEKLADLAREAKRRKWSVEKVIARAWCDQQALVRSESADNPVPK